MPSPRHLAQDGGFPFSVEQETVWIEIRPSKAPQVQIHLTLAHPGQGPEVEARFYSDVRASPGSSIFGEMD